MTLVLACITKHDKIIVKSDRRTIDDSNSIISDKAEKIITINSRCILGFAGYVKCCNEVLSYLYNQNPTREKWYPEDIFSAAFLYRVMNPSIKKMEMLVCGFMKNNKPILLTFASDTNTRILYPKDTKCVQLGLHYPECKINFDEEDEQLIRDNMESFIVQQSELNFGIGDKIQTEEIFLLENFINKLKAENTQK